jgi:hypothetical protein
MSAGRSSRLAYIVPVSHERQQEQSVDAALMVTIAALVITGVALLTDPTILGMATRMLDTAWYALVSAIMHR